MTTEEIHKLPYKAQLYINELQRKLKDLLKNNKDAINYTSCCESDNELLDCDFGVIVGKEAHFYKDSKIIKKEALKFSNSEESNDKAGCNNIEDTNPYWEMHIKGKQ